MYPFGIIGVVLRYIPAGAVIELAGIRLSCTSAPTGIWKKHRRGESNSGALIPCPKLRTFPSKVSGGLHPTPPVETYDGPALRLMSILSFSWGRVRGVVRVRVRVRVYACVSVCVCVCDFCVCVFVCS